MVPAQLEFTTEARRKINEHGSAKDFPCALCVIDFDFMSIVRLKIDVAGTVGDEAWREINQFDQIQSANFGPQFGSGGPSASPVATAASAVPLSEARLNPYPKGAWIGAEIKLQTPLLAQYAVSHYLEQERVLDADVVE
jgi:hypothetical protein